jgi:hypothetical protein
VHRYLRSHAKRDRTDQGNDSDSHLVTGTDLPAICRPLTRGAAVPTAGTRTGGTPAPSQPRRVPPCPHRVERAFDLRYGARSGAHPASRAPTSRESAERQRPAKALVQLSSARGHAVGYPEGFRRHCHDRCPPFPAAATARRTRQARPCNRCSARTRRGLARRGVPPRAGRVGPAAGGAVPVPEGGDAGAPGR